jgi:hypothetical protein
VFGATENDGKQKSFFSLNKKTFLIFEKTVNRFLNLNFAFKLFILARMFEGIRYRQTLEFVGGPNLSQRFIDFGIQAPESRDTGRQISITVVGIQPAGARIWPFARNLGNCSRI